MQLLTLFLVISGLVVPLTALNMLGIFTFPDQTHSSVYNTLFLELSRRGHNLTVITNFLIPEKPSNYREILIKPYLDIETRLKELLKVSTLENVQQTGVTDIVAAYQDIGLVATEHALKSENVKQFFEQVGNDSFDLIILDELYQEAFLALGSKFDCPSLSLSVRGVQQYMLRNLGIEFYPFLIDHHLSIPQNTFLSRMSNLYHSFYDKKRRESTYIPGQEHLVQKYMVGPLFESAETIPDIKFLQRKISFTLTNSQPFFEPFLTRPGNRLIHIGGMHIGRPKELSRDLNDFLSSAQYGAVFVSVPITVFGVKVPIELVETLLDGFSGLKQKILLQWSGEKPKDIPKNVFQKMWMPQADVLAHPYVQMIVTFGDYLSIQEAIYRSVPILSIPISREQVINSRVISEGSFGIVMPLFNVSSVSIIWATKQLLSNQDYLQNMRQASKLFRDRPIGPLEEAVYWIEFSYRFKDDVRVGLNQKYLNYSWWTHYNIDILGSFCLLLILIIYVPSKIILTIYKRRKESAEPTKSKKIV